MLNTLMGKVTHGMFSHPLNTLYFRSFASAATKYVTYCSE